MAQRKQQEGTKNQIISMKGMKELVKTRQPDRQQKYVTEAYNTTEGHGDG